MSVKRSILKISVTLLVFFWAGFAMAQDSYKVQKVVIDAGHGGHDPGAVGKLSKEKDIALAISLKLGEYIKTNFKGVQVVYTRKTDKFLKLWERTEIANKENADLFISIHCNASESSKPKGTETYVLGVHKDAASLAVAQKENAAILLEADYDKRYNNFDPYSAESYIIFSLLKSAYREQSTAMAKMVQDQFRDRVQRVDRGVKEAGYLVLVNATMPSILIEAGFISNPTEEKFLNSKQGQDYLASAIFRAFRDYKKAMEANQVSPGNPNPGLEPEPKVDTSSSAGKDTASTDQKATANDQTIVFGVQFTTSVKKKPSSLFTNVPDVWSYQQNEMYKYVSGHFTTIEEANQHLFAIREKGFGDAFVVAFKDGERIKPSEAVRLLNEQKKP